MRSSASAAASFGLSETDRSRARSTTPRKRIRASGCSVTSREKNLPAVYADVDALVLPSLYEPWGLVVHEGLANGLPVIVTDQVGSADDLVESGVNGYVVPAGSVEAFGAAMRDLASWSQEQRQLSLRHSAETIRRCSVERSRPGIPASRGDRVGAPREAVSRPEESRWPPADRGQRRFPKKWTSNFPPEDPTTPRASRG